MLATARKCVPDADHASAPHSWQDPTAHSSLSLTLSSLLTFQSPVDMRVAWMRVLITSSGVVSNAAGMAATPPANSSPCGVRCPECGSVTIVCAISQEIGELGRDTVLTASCLIESVRAVNMWSRQHGKRGMPFQTKTPPLLTSTTRLLARKHARVRRSLAYLERDVSREVYCGEECVAQQGGAEASEHAREAQLADVRHHPPRRHRVHRLAPSPRLQRMRVLCAR